MQRALGVRFAERPDALGKEEAGSAFGTGPVILDKVEELYSSSIWL